MSLWTYDRGERRLENRGEMGGERGIKRRGASKSPFFHLKKGINFLWENNKQGEGGEKRDFSQIRQSISKETTGLDARPHNCREKKSMCSFQEFKHQHNQKRKFMDQSQGGELGKGGKKERSGGGKRNLS